MVFLAPVIALRGQRWIDLFSEALIPEKQPVWFWAAGAFAAFLTLITWYVQITSPVTLSWVMTLFITLSLVKAYCFIFRYEQARKVTLSLMDKGRTFTAGLVGILFIRTLEQAERTHMAMIARGYDGTIRLLRPLQWKSHDTLFVAVTAIYLFLMRWGGHLGGWLRD